MVARFTAVVLVALAFAGCSSPSSQGAVSGGPLALHAEYPAWVLDPAAGWDPLARPTALFVRADASRIAGVDAAEDAAFDAALAALGADLADLIVTVGARAAAGDEDLASSLTSAAFVDDVLTDALDRSVDGPSEPRVVGKWFDLDNVILRVRYDVERGLLATYFEHVDRVLRAAGHRPDGDLHAALRQDVASEVARLNHGR